MGEVMRKSFVLACLLAAGSVFAQEESKSQEAEKSTMGKTLYEHFCASCHGASAKGDGPVGQFLSSKPSDLTQLAKKNNGKFPYDRVFGTIDGRVEIGAHGPADMPVWGRELRERSGGRSSAAVKSQITAMVHYLQTLQEK
jgi:mono/diheme cytochrome c family protein